MSEIIPLSFLIHRRYFHILSWGLSFLLTLSVKWPLCKRLILLLITIFRRGPIFALCCQHLGAVFICAGKWSVNSIQIIWPVKPIWNPDSTAFLPQNQYSTSSRTPGRQSWDILRPSALPLNSVSYCIYYFRVTSPGTSKMSPASSSIVALKD